MTTFNIDALFPTRDLKTVTDDELLRALRALGLPAYQARTIYAQFGRTVGRPNDYPLFLTFFGKTQPATPPGLNTGTPPPDNTRGGRYPYRS